MSRDYKSRKSSSQKGRKPVLIAGIFIGYTLGILTTIGIWFYLEQAPSPFLSEKQINGYDRAFEQTDQPTQASFSASAHENNRAAASEENVQFDYYKILQNSDESYKEQANTQNVEPSQNMRKTAVSTNNPPKPTPPSPALDRTHDKPADAGAAEKYYIQVGSFRNNADADNLKARLALLGVIASVQSADLSDRGIWHRVRIGPFTQKGQMEKINYTLQENGIEAQLIKAH